MKPTEKASFVQPPSNKQNTSLSSVLEPFLLSLDIDECAAGTHDCSPDALCVNLIGSYNCTCKQGFLGNGKDCQGRMQSSLQRFRATCKGKGKSQVSR